MINCTDFPVVGKSPEKAAAAAAFDSAGPLQANPPENESLCIAAVHVLELCIGAGYRIATVSVGATAQEQPWLAQ